MRPVIITLLFITAAVCLFGCAGSKEPAGPDTGVPVFDVVVDQPVIAPLENTRVSLQPVLTLDFEQLDGMLVWFRDDPDSGTFGDFPSRYIDISTVDNLNLPIWYQYLGQGGADTIKVKIYAHVVGDYGDTLAWNYTVVNVVGGF